MPSRSDFQDLPGDADDADSRFTSDDLIWVIPHCWAVAGEEAQRKIRDPLAATVSFPHFHELRACSALKITALRYFSGSVGRVRANHVGRKYAPRDAYSCRASRPSAPRLSGGPRCLGTSENR